jgi:uncharacterized protein
VRFRDCCQPRCFLPTHTFPPPTHRTRSVIPKATVTVAKAGHRQLSTNFLLAIDLFNCGYYWEAHEEWERLWRASNPESIVGRFLKGLVKLSAAGVKVREKSIHGVRRHAASAGEVFADVAAESGLDVYAGLRLTHLQFAADRAAQLPYQDKLKAGDPVKVFPFVIEPEQLPLG